MSKRNKTRKHRSPGGDGLGQYIAPAKRLGLFVLVDGGAVTIWRRATGELLGTWIIQSRTLRIGQHIVGGMSYTDALKRLVESNMPTGR